MATGAGFTRPLAAATLLALLAVLPAGIAHAAPAPPPAQERRAGELADMSLGELMNVEVESVLGASRYVQRSLDAPTRVTVLNADDIRDHGYRTLAEALRSVTGVFVTYDRDYEYAGMRGWGHVDDYNARTLVLVDEHRLNDNLFEGGLIGTDCPIDIEQVERIEVIRGPCSALYGSNAFLGVINVVTRRAVPADAFSVSGDAGAFGTRDGRVAFSRRFTPHVSLQLSGSVYGSDGISRLYFPEFDSPRTHGGFADHLDGDRAQRLYADLSLGELRVQGVYGDRRKDVPTAAWATKFDARDNWTQDTRGWVDLGLRHEFANRIDVSGRLYFDDYRYAGSYPYDYSGTDTGSVTINRDDDLGRWWGAEVNAHRTLFATDELVVGGEFRDNFRQDQRNWDVAPYSQYLDDRRHSRVGALYAENALPLTPRLRLNTGVRHDVYTAFGSSTHPRIGLIYSLFERTVVKLIYGSAFRVPTTYELYFGGDGYHPNAALRPESFRTGEASIESYFTRHYHASASWFVYRADDVIRQSLADSASEYFNGSSVRGTGVEAEIAGRWREYELRVGGAAQRVRQLPLDAWPANSPTHSFQAAGRMPLVARRLWLTADLRTMSVRRGATGLDVPGYAITDANLLGTLPGGAAQLTLGVRNLFDASYGDVGGVETPEISIPQDRRTIRARLDLRF